MQNPKPISKHKKIFVSLAFFVTSMMPFAAQAAMINSDMLITASVLFNDDPAIGSLPPIGSAAQSANLKAIQGGVETNTSVNGMAVTGDNPLGGMLTEINDGVGINASILGSGDSEVEAFIFDYLFRLENTSLTDDITVSFTVNYATTVDSEGADAYADNRLVLLDSMSNEMFFSDLTSDTVNGNEKNGNATGNTGGNESDIGTYNFDIVVAANTIYEFIGEVKLDGGAFDPSSMFSAMNNSFIFISNVTNPTMPPPPSVPTKYAFLYLLLGLGLLSSRKHMKH